MRPPLERGKPAAPKPADTPEPRLGRRSFLGFGAALTGSLALGARTCQARNLSQPPRPPTRHGRKRIGPGVVDRPYGRPADTEAGVIRRNVPWLTAGTESSISFSPLQDLHGIITPNGLFFERYHAGRAGRRSGSAPADDPWPGRAAADC